MEDYPRNLAEFEARFSTEAACRESGAAAVAGWFSLPALRRTEDLASARGAAAMCGLRVSEFSDGRDHLPGHPETAHDLVSCDVGSHQPEERRQCHRTATRAGLGQLRHGVDLAA